MLLGMGQLASEGERLLGPRPSLIRMAEGRSAWESQCKQTTRESMA